MAANLLERSDSLEQLRVGVQDYTSDRATLMTAVAATTRPLSLMLTPTPDETLSDVEAAGYTVPVGSTSEQSKHTTLAVAGRMAYYDAALACAVALCKPAISTPGTGPTLAVKTRRYGFVPLANYANDSLFLTVDNGSGPGFASRCALATIINLGFTFQKDTCTFTGNGLAQRLAEAGVTLSDESVLNTLPLVPIDGDDWSLYVADSVVGLVDAAKYLRCNSATIGFNALREADYAGDNAQQSIVGYAEPKQKNVVGGINIQQNADAFAAMAAMRNKSMKYCRIVACGPDIETVGGVTYRHRLQITYSFNFRAPQPGVEQSVKTGQFPTAAIARPNGQFAEILIDIDSTQVSNFLAPGTALGSGQQPTTLIPLETCGASA